MTLGVPLSILLLLSLSLSFSFADDFIFQQKVTLHTNVTYYTVPAALPLSGNSSFLLSVSSSKELSSLAPFVTVCFSEFFLPYREASEWSEDTCAVFLNMSTSNAATMSQSFVDPAPGRYFVTLYVPLGHENVSEELDLTVSGLKCANGSFGVNCKTKEQVLQIGVEYTLPLDPSSPLFVGSFFLDTNINLLLFKAAMFPASASSRTSLSASSVESSSSASTGRRRRRRDNDGYVFALRYENVFMDKSEKDIHYMVLKNNQSSSSLSVSVPRPGKWFLSIFPANGPFFRPSASLSVKFQLQTTQCASNRTKGVDCQTIKMLKEQSVYEIQSTSNESVVYLAFSYLDFFFNQSSNSTKTVSLFLSFTDYSANAPHIWLKYAQVPTDSSYDASSGTGNSSVSILNITFPSQENGTDTDDLFYIAVEKGQKDVVFWYNELCPNRCSGQGKCVVDSDHGFHKCKCRSGWEGYDCRLESDKMSELAVTMLLVAYMVALVLGLVVIGFAFHRKEIDKYILHKNQQQTRDPAVTPLLSDDE